MIPNKATGAGNNNATVVFKATFSEDLSSSPRIEAWDNSQTFPAVDVTGSTISKEIFTGTTGNGSKPMLAGYIGGLSDAPELPGASWHPASAVAGGANPNLLKGSTNFVNTTVIPGAGGADKAIVFNLSQRVPFDATVPSTSSMNALVLIRCNYTGAAPIISLAFNKGTEDTPSWTTMTAGTHGVRFCNAGTISGGPYKLTLPESGTVDAGEQWVTKQVI